MYHSAALTVPEPILLSKLGRLGGNSTVAAQRTHETNSEHVKYFLRVRLLARF